jgi:hypothetical protein
MKDVFLSEDLAIGTFRYAVGTMIPQVTQVAWEKKRSDIEKLHPNVQRSAFVYTYKRSQFEKEFGSTYKRPGVFARFFVWIVRVMPKIGPFRALAFKAPTPEAERLFTESFKTARDRYRASLEAARANRLNLANADFDTGRPTTRREYPLADETYAELLDRLTSKKPITIPTAMRADILRFYGTVDASQASDKKDREKLEKIEKQLALLK